MHMTMNINGVNKMHDILPVPVCYNITKSSGKKLTWKIFVKQYKRSALKNK